MLVPTCCPSMCGIKAGIYDVWTKERDYSYIYLLLQISSENISLFRIINFLLRSFCVHVQEYFNEALLMYYLQSYRKQHLLFITTIATLISYMGSTKLITHFCKWEMGWEIDFMSMKCRIGHAMAEFYHTVWVSNMKLSPSVIWGVLVKTQDRCSRAFNAVFIFVSL